LVTLPYWDVDGSLTELSRTADKGARSVTFPKAPHRLGLPSFHTDHWDGLFARRRRQKFHCRCTSVPDLFRAVGQLPLAP